MWLRDAQNSLEDSTIIKCCAKCGIPSNASSSSEEIITDDHSTEAAEEIQPLLNGLTLQQFAQQDDDLATSQQELAGSDWEEQFINKAREGLVESDDENRAMLIDVEETEKEVQEVPVISVEQAAKMVQELQWFELENNKTDIVEAMLVIEEPIAQLVALVCTWCLLLNVTREAVRKISIVFDFFVHV